MVDGLGIYVAVKDIDPAGSDSITNYDDTRGVSRGIGYVYENTQAAVSYAIPNIGLARVQYVGAHPGINPDTAKLLPSAIAGISAPNIQAAFAFTGVPNLTVDVGGKFFLPVEDPKPEAAFLGPSETEIPGTFKAPIEVGLGVQYAAGNLTAIFIVDGKFAGSVETAAISPNDPLELGMELRPWLTVRYKLNDTFTIQGEGGVIYAGDSEVDGNVVAAGGMRYGFGAGVQIDFVSAPNCRLRAGVTYAGGEGANFGNPDDGKKLNGVFNVPLAFSVEF
jgi:hypothetical protein